MQALDITAFLQGTPVLGSSGWVGRMPRDGHRGGGIEAWCSRAMCDATGHAAPPSLRPGDPRSGLVGHSVSLGRHARVVRAKAIRGAGVPWLVVAGHAALAITTPGLHYSPKTRRPRRPDGEGDLDARWCVDADGGLVRVPPTPGPDIESHAKKPQRATQETRPTQGLEANQPQDQKAAGLVHRKPTRIEQPTTR